MTLKDWHLLPLQSVCAVNPKLGDDVPKPDTLVSFVPMAAVAEQGGGIIQAETRPYSEVAKGYTYFREKDVLFETVAPLPENG
jgi:type I restriction enzyme S subunit